MFAAVSSTADKVLTKTNNLEFNLSQEGRKAKSPQLWIPAQEKAAALQGQTRRSHPFNEPLQGPSTHPQAPPQSFLGVSIHGEFSFKLALFPYANQTYLLHSSPGQSQPVASKSPPRSRLKAHLC